MENSNSKGFSFSSTFKSRYKKPQTIRCNASKLHFTTNPRTIDIHSNDTQGTMSVPYEYAKEVAMALLEAHCLNEDYLDNKEVEITISVKIITQ